MSTRITATRATALAQDDALIKSVALQLTSAVTGTGKRRRQSLAASVAVPQSPRKSQARTQSRSVSRSPRKPRQSKKRPAASISDDEVESEDEEDREEQEVESISVRRPAAKRARKSVGAGRRVTIHEVKDFSLLTFLVHSTVSHVVSIAYLERGDHSSPRGDHHSPSRTRFSAGSFSTSPSFLSSSRPWTYSQYNPVRSPR